MHKAMTPTVVAAEKLQLDDLRPVSSVCPHLCFCSSTSSCLRFKANSSRSFFERNLGCSQKDTEDLTLSTGREQACYSHLPWRELLVLLASFSTAPPETTVQLFWSQQVPHYHLQVVVLAARLVDLS